MALQCPKCDFTTEFGEGRLKTHITKMHGSKRASNGRTTKRTKLDPDARYREAVKLFYPELTDADLDFMDQLYERTS